MITPDEDPPATVELVPQGEGPQDTPGPEGWDHTDAVVAAWLHAKTASSATRQSYAVRIGAPEHVRRAVPGGPRQPGPPDPLTWIPWAREHDIPPLAPRPDHIDAWLSATAASVASKQISDNTRIHRYKAFSALLSWAAHKRYIEPVVLPDQADRRAHGVTNAATKGKAATGLPPEAVEALLWAADHDDRTRSHKPGAATAEERKARSQVLLALLLGGGIRTSELIDLDITDYWRPEPHGSGRLNLTGKGREKAEQPIPAWAATVVDSYLQSGRVTRSKREIERSSGAPSRSGDVPLVSTDDGQRLNRATINKILSRLARLPQAASDDPEERAHAATLARLPRKPNGQPAVHPHQLRHAAGHRILDAGGDIEDVRTYLRHRSIATSQTYVASRERRTDRVADVLG